MDKKEITQNQIRIFRNLFEQHGNSPMGVSSESLVHKRLRFSEILEFMDVSTNFSVHDVGMGLAHFHDFLEEKLNFIKFEYSGSEILEEYVNSCRERLPSRDFFHRNISENKNIGGGGWTGEVYDYVVLSGVFHQMRETPITDWEIYLKSLLRNCFQMAKKGIVFNLVSPYVDFYQTGIYYARLPKILDFITEELSRFFVIRHNYALFEFTICVYQKDYVKTKFQEPEFQKYFR
jgi:hypothetical protein